LTKQDKIVRLRRGKYLLGPQYRKFTPSSYYISNYLYRPSYVSLETALQYYDLIPEAVGLVQAVTPKHGREWSNDYDRFVCRSMKGARFWGVSRRPSGKHPLSEPVLHCQTRKGNPGSNLLKQWGVD